MATHQLRPVLVLVRLVRGLAPGLSALGARVGLDMKQGERPRRVFGQPQGLALGDHPAEEHAAGDTPGPGGF